MRFFRSIKTLAVLGVSAVLTTGCLGGLYRLAPGVPEGWGNCQYAVMIHQVWHADQDWAQQIAWRESRCQANAYNRSGSKGLFQLLGHDDLLTKACGSPKWSDPLCNAKAAWMLYQGSGRRPWNL